MLWNNNSSIFNNKRDSLHDVKYHFDKFFFLNLKYLVVEVILFLGASTNVL